MALVMETTKYKHKTKGYICNVLNISPFKLADNVAYQYIAYQILHTDDMSNHFFYNQWHLKEKEEFLKEYEPIQVQHTLSAANS